ncbi:hypothetical protein K7432_017533 [Basidiobolus ranarum]|uniref:Uncharacterized protein n=1 Tax=Basidiobolus ranarum TaxID=34480 RepID=A0ABR2VK83_9FUNG
MEKIREVLTTFKDSNTLVETETGPNIKQIQTDNGGEDTSTLFKHLSKVHGIKQETTAAVVVLGCKQQL